MKYRRFGRLDWQVSALGFGAMRLPTIGGDHNKIDEVEAIKMLRYAIDHGVNYIDTAYPYHGGNSEVVVGKALGGGYRDKVKLATKMPTWMVNSQDDMVKYLDEQLKRLQTDHVDFYLLHGLNKERWAKMRELGALDWAERAIDGGKVRHLGFSFHDDLETFRGIIDGYGGWTLCQIQYNFENEELQAGTKGLEYAADKGLAVVIMEPLLGGYLVNPPVEVQGVWDSDKRNPVDMALQWLWNKPAVSVVLSGMSAMEQVQQNVESASASGVGSLKEEDLSLVRRVHDKYAEIRPIPCTKCEYCMPCPNGVNIPRNFELYNQGIAYNKMDKSRRAYERHMPENERASACKGCRTCEEKCPQGIAISEWMPRVHNELGPK